MATVATARIVSGKAFGTVLVVDATRIGVGEGFVGFGNLDKLLVRTGVIGIFIRVEFLGKFSVGSFYVSVVCVFTYSQELSTIAAVSFVFFFFPSFSPTAQSPWKRKGADRNAYLVVILCQHQRQQCQ